MEIDVVAEKLTAKSMVAKLVMHQRLRERHDQMGCDGDHEAQ
jgi:hypothetical protein